MEDILFFRPIDSLLSLAINAIAMSLKLDLESLSMLPIPLKSTILRVMCKRGNLTSDFMSALLIPGVDTLDLSECVVTNEHLRIIPRCIHLHHLNMNRGRYQKHTFTTEELLKLLPSLPLLTDFYAQGSDRVTDEVMGAMVTCCPNLSALDLGGCDLTDEAAKHISSLEHLMSLNVSNTRITDDGIESLTKGPCRYSLLEIKLNNCRQLTDRAIHSIADHCINIRTLVFSGCPQITSECEQILTCLLSKCQVKHLTYTVY